jgi:predicted dehydrogenase
MNRNVNVGLIGASFMGKAHSHAYHDMSFFFKAVPTPVKKVLCDINEELLEINSKTFQWEKTTTSLEELVNMPEVDLIDICTPGNLHKEAVISAAKAGKNVFCEKPLANNLRDAREMLDAVTEAGVKHMVGFCYRRIPAVKLAKKLIEEGAIGKINQIRALYLQDWILDPEFPLVWRLRKEIAGSGANGDLNSHIIDLARYLVGEFDEVVGLSKTFIKKRPLPGTVTGLSATKDANAEMGEVTVDDATLFLANFKNGAIGTFEATRFAGGHKNGNSFEINGSKGSIRFTFEKMNELEFWSSSDPKEIQGFRTISVTEPEHPYMKSWWPAGHIIGYEHTFIHELRDYMEDILLDRMPEPNFYDGVKCQEVLEAVELSVRERRWVKISEV